MTIPDVTVPKLNQSVIVKPDYDNKEVKTRKLRLMKNKKSKHNNTQSNYRNKINNSETVSKL